MRTILKLEDGLDWGYDDNGNKTICRGAKMGRRNTLPDDKEASIKLRLERLKWVDGDYDQGGAYWGRSKWGESIYCAWNVEGVRVFVRGSNREEAKSKVIEDLPNAKFFK